jgi:Family of unknown function (DUF6496)
MPERETVERAREDAREGKSPSTQAGEFVREEIHHVREGKHGVRSAKQAIAIGLSKARHAGVRLAPPRKGKALSSTRHRAARDYRNDRKEQGDSRRRSRATMAALKTEGRRAASRKALSKQAHAASRQRASSARHNSARKAVRTKGKSGLSRTAQKAARTRRARARKAGGVI